MDFTNHRITMAYYMNTPQPYEKRKKQTGMPGIISPEHEAKGNYDTNLEEYIKQMTLTRSLIF